MNDDEYALRLCREQWQALMHSGITLAALQAFYARYKYLIMSRHLPSYRAIGRLLAQVDKKDLSAVAQQMLDAMLDALARPETRGGNVNALLHISGYLKSNLTADEKSALSDAIDRYRIGAAEFEVPAALLRGFFARFPNRYIETQIFLYAPESIARGG